MERSTERPSRRLALAAALLALAGLGLPAPRAGADGATTLPAPTAVDTKVPAFRTTDTEGRPFDSGDLDVRLPAVAAAVREAARAFGARADATWATPLTSLPGVKDEDGAPDPDRLAALVAAAGAPFGRVAHEEQVAGLATLGALRDWVAAAADQPVVYIAWSPKCPTSKKLNERLQDVIARTGVRAYAVLVNKGDDVATVQMFRERYGFPLRVLQDTDFAIGGRLGAERTPHFILVDKDGVLRYRGALDNDLHDVYTGDERQDYLIDAIAAVRSGRAVAQPVTEPFG